MKPLMPLIAAISLLTNLCSADMYVEYIHYLAEPELSKITLYLDLVRGNDAVPRFEKNQKAYEKDGKYLTNYDYALGKKTVVKEETIDGHTIKTILDIYPPTGHGMGGALPRCNCIIWIDGEKRLEKELYGDEDTGIHQIVVYTEDNVIAVLGAQGDQYFFSREFLSPKIKIDR